MNLSLRSLVALDTNVLRSIVGENRAMRTQLLSSFVEEAEHKLEELSEASGAGRLAEVRIAAHQLRGAARIVGAVALAETARLLEGVHDEEAERVVAQQLCGELGKEVERFKGALSQVQ
jgi:HPt (histidine-containing phosphotransfer) domain-containing protein